MMPSDCQNFPVCCRHRHSHRNAAITRAPSWPSLWTSPLPPPDSASQHPSPPPIPVPPRAVPDTWHRSRPRHHHQAPPNSTSHRARRHPMHRSSMPDRIPTPCSSPARMRACSFGLRACLHYHRLSSMTAARSSSTSQVARPSAPLPLFRLANLVFIGCRTGCFRWHISFRKMKAITMIHIPF
jgi:hypothetical protein